MAIAKYICALCKHHNISHLNSFRRDQQYDLKKTEYIVYMSPYRVSVQKINYKKLIATVSVVIYLQFRTGLLLLLDSFIAVNG